MFLLFLVLVGVGVEGPEAGDDEMSDEQEDIGLVYFVMSVLCFLLCDFRFIRFQVYF